MFDFTRADAKRECAESAMRARVTVAANDRHSGLSQTKFWSNDMNDALFGRVDVEQLNAKLFAVFRRVFRLVFAAVDVGDRQTAIGSWNVVIDGAES